MSFSGKVKEELSRQVPSARHCQIAEITAIITMCGRILIGADDTLSVVIHTENLAVARKYFTLIKKTFNISTEISIRQNTVLKKSRVYTVVIRKHEDSIRVLSASKLIDDMGEIREDLSLVSNRIVQSSCCKRAFIRGAYLAAGSMSDPNKSYHFEIVCTTEAKAEQLRDIIGSFGLDARVVFRKRHYVVYLKEGSGIVDMLNVMEAHVALMQLENVRIVKEVRNSVNRRVNCETANINKTVSAAVKQIEDIKLIDTAIGLNNLPDSLKELAELRVMNPDASLIVLGGMLVPPVGKSGVNHRLRKIAQIADEIRENEGGSTI